MNVEDATWEIVDELRTRVDFHRSNLRASWLLKGEMMMSLVARESYMEGCYAKEYYA